MRDDDGGITLFTGLESIGADREREWVATQPGGPFAGAHVGAP